jgi:phenylalanyl-tRNA synthetase beta chain
VSREVDLIEEVARVRGLDRIPTRLPAIAPQSQPHAGEFERRVADTAVALGLSEALTYAFVARGDLEKVHAPAPIVRLSNPLSEERSVLRTSLVPALLDALGRARKRGELSVRLFSMGATFSTLVAKARTGTRARPEGDVGKLPDEPLRFAAVLAGPRREHLVLNPPDVDVYDGKALAFELVERLSGRKADVRLAQDRDSLPHLHPRGAAEVLVDGAIVGHFGPLHPDVLSAFDLGTSAVLVELDLEAVERLGNVTPRYRPIPRVPAITRDLSLLVTDDVLAGRVAEVLEKAAGELCESLEVVADFRGNPVPNGQRSLTFRVVYRDPNARRGGDEGKTLTDKDVEAVERRMLDTAKNELGATLRA